FNFFNGLGGMAMIAAFWGIWHLISAFGLAMFWKHVRPLTKD
ncbi:MAG: bile acid:sodium symporter family protein, partial [Bacteroidota bacterium]